MPATPKPGRRVLCALALAALALGGCETTGGLNSPTGPGGNHAAWCGTNPPSGYCIVPESQ